MEFHVFASYFPLLEGEDFESLVEDIRDNGLIEPIVLHEGKILDGRNRYLACQAAEVEPRFTTYAGDSPLQYVISMNVHRRHMTKSQLAMIAMDSGLLAELEAEAAERQKVLGRTHGEDPSANIGGRGEAPEQAARIMGIGKTTIKEAKRIAKEAPDLADQMRAGEIGTGTAAKMLRERQRLEQVKDSVARDKAKAKTKRQNEMAEVREVKQYTDAMSLFNRALTEALDAKRRGKFSPEAIQFVANRHKSIRNKMQKLENDDD